MRTPFIAAAVAAGLTTLAAAQSPSSADIAQNLTGTWKLNKELSPNLSAPMPPGRPGGRGGALLALAAPQRGGRGGGGGGGAAGGPEPSNMMPGEAAAQAALNVLHQVPLELQIIATPGDVSFIDPRGKWDFKVDGKTIQMQVPGGTIKTKSKWEKGGLRQEFSSTERTLLKSWSLDTNGRLVLTEHIESIAFNTKESKAVYDRVQ